MLNKEKALVDESLNIFSNDIVTQHKKKLGKDPAFLMYSNDFLSNTAGLTLEEKGIYITLVCLLHQQGHLSMKTIWLHFGFNNICKLEDFDINNYFSRDLLENFRFDKNGKLYAIYFEQIFEERAKFVASRQINGRK